ncbi:MAG: SH3 domain-containing protein [Thermomicrobiales bacterium]|nr:SH3 domain-containing protein [Thermomicrobiales bacterium]
MNSGGWSRGNVVAGWRRYALMVSFVAVLLPLIGAANLNTANRVAAADVIAIGSVIEINDPQLYLRSAPGFDSTVLAHMELKTRGTVLAGPVAANGLDWYQIQTSRYGTGWAAGKYLKVISAPVATATPTGGWAAGSTIEVIDPQLYLRSAPGFGSTVLAKMALGTRGTVLSGPQYANGHPWYQIRTNAYGTGWASGTYLRLISAAQPTATPPPGTIGIGASVQTTAVLNLRTGPSLTSTIAAVMVNGARATVVAGPTWAGGIPWYQVRTTAYGTGWASGNYLVLAGTSALLTKPTDGLSRLIYNGVSSRNEVAITIDAGADRGWAEEMLDVLAANGVKVTWGMTGAWASANPDLIERMVNEGHQIMNHTWSHPSFTGVSASPAMTSSTARKSELTGTADYVYNLTGYRMSPYWRPPYGDINTSVRRDAYDAGYWQTVMWSIDSMGWNGASVSQILNKCAWGAKAGDIILLHVGYSSKDYASLQQMITILQNRGFALVTVEELLG